MMIYWIILWVLVVLLLAAVYTTIRFYNSIEVLEARLDAEQSRSLGLKREVGYWMRLHDNVSRRYRHTDKGLQDILKIRTNVMANVGSRMSRIASLALDKAAGEPFNKE